MKKGIVHNLGREGDDLLSLLFVLAHKVHSLIKRIRSHFWTSEKMVAGCWLAPRCQRRVLIIHFLWKSVRWKPKPTQRSMSKIISDIVSANNMSVANQEETYPSLLSYLRPDLPPLSPLPLWSPPWRLCHPEMYSHENKKTNQPTSQTKKQFCEGCLFLQLWILSFSRAQGGARLSQPRSDLEGRQA